MKYYVKAFLQILRLFGYMAGLFLTMLAYSFVSVHYTGTPAIGILAWIVSAFLVVGTWSLGNDLKRKDGK